MQSGKWEPQMIFPALSFPISVASVIGNPTDPIFSSFLQCGKGQIVPLAYERKTCFCGKIHQATWGIMNIYFH